MLCSPLFYRYAFCRTPCALSLRSALHSPFRRHFTLGCRGGSSAVVEMEVATNVLKQAIEKQDQVALRADQKNYSYVEIASAALNISSILRKADIKDEGNKDSTAINGTVKGVKFLHGSRVGVVAKPSAEFVAGILGTWLSGGVAVPLALSYPEAELLHVMNDSDVSMILSTDDHQELMKNIAAKCSAQFSLLPTVSCTSENSREIVTGKINSISELMTKIEHSLQNEVGDPALILYTSGTTGKPKGVVHTHKGIVSQVQILMEAWEYSSNDRLLHCLPLHHVHGLFNGLLAPLYAGSVVEFMPKFSVRGVWQRWRESYSNDGSKADDAITMFTGVPTIYSRLLQGYEAMEPDMKKESASAANKLRLMMCGSSALPYPVLKKWEEVTGQRLLERYGMTEFVMALSNPLHGIRKPNTVGKPLPRVEVKIISDDGKEVGTKGEGELCVRSPSLFKEYWKQPQVTKESFTDGGFFRTGDSVTTDEDGYYIILGRTNADIMKVGGYKLSALEIEAVLLEHEIVSECCVLGVPDKDYGEIVCAIIVPKAEAKNRAEQEMKPAITLGELQDWSKDKLAPYKIPTKLILWDALPRNAMGKVNKKQIRKLFD